MKKCNRTAVVIFFVSVLGLIFSLRIDLHNYDEILRMVNNYDKTLQRIRECDKILQWISDKVGCDIISLIRRLVPDDMDDILDTFNRIWELIITLAIFIFEISGTYIYGITLRRIAGLTFGKKKIIIALVGYFLLYPVIYTFSSINFKVTVIWCVFVIFTFLISLIWFCIYATRVSFVEPLLCECTKKQIIDKCSEGPVNSVHPKKKSAAYAGIRGDIEQLYIVDMLEHINYSDEREVNNLKNVICRLITDTDISSHVKGTSFEHTILLPLIMRIVVKSGMETEYDRQRTSGIIREIRGMIIDSKDISRMMKLSFSVQLLLPFINLNDQNASDTMVQIWKSYDNDRNMVLPYLILYTEFQYKVMKQRECVWVQTDDRDMKWALQYFCDNPPDINETFIKTCYLDWTQYDMQRSNVHLEVICNFIEDIKKLKYKAGIVSKTKTITQILRR